MNKGRSAHMDQGLSKFKNRKIKLKNLSTRIFNGKSLVLSQTTPYEIVAHYHKSNVRYYAAKNRKHLEPLVFVAPLAINMSIYDLYPYRSLVKHFSDSGYDVYLVDWGKLTYADQELNFLNFIDEALPFFVDKIREHSHSDQISLHGWSMAGIFALLYTAYRQPNYVKNLIVLGSPIDSYASGGLGKLYKNLHEYIRNIPKLKKVMFYGRIPNRLIHTPGILNAIGFKILDPKGWYEGHKQLLLNLDDQQTLHEHATLGNFLNHMIDYPGGVNQDMIFNVWLQNPLKNGVIKLYGKEISIKNIDCSLFVGAGKSDQMVLAASVEPLTQITKSKDVTYTLIPGGHLGLMSSQKSSEQFWPVLTQWLDDRSTPYPVKNLDLNAS
ncbi:hypothetical protein F960_01441 [Acinetobacter gerneri DSM 14967 = CIP 107464 = MTCC 9824]|jgi:poly(3-hydroxyalkanoate) synthetase|uniref:AB hydrolase-1 domain-containing protein n=2 Tax=Acinetobacter gerneri TaxID=202952 RepID=N8ZKV0_9GAMM|nr:hypothetical protein F960_01441 [Acinetobacter gerneri DSM 14967 = CIP 107464 = MTCC 9824]